MFMYNVHVKTEFFLCCALLATNLTYIWKKYVKKPTKKKKKCTIQSEKIRNSLCIADKVTIQCCTRIIIWYMFAIWIFIVKRILHINMPHRKIENRIRWFQFQLDNVCIINIWKYNIMGKSWRNESCKVEILKLLYYDIYKYEYMIWCYRLYI